MPYSTACSAHRAIVSVDRDSTDHQFLKLAGYSRDRMRLPHPVPELPVSDVRAAGQSYVRQMGFSVDWSYQDSLAGISRDDARVFLRRRTPEEAEKRHSVLVWLNMASSAEVDQLYAEWKQRGALIVEDLRTAPYNLREFTAQDPDGNRIRVFYDLGKQGTWHRGRRTMS